ncbi:MAG: DUF1702 family protein [Blastochloris sp.]|nr:DUF1702 family protein [Blastochloris sp.]
MTTLGKLLRPIFGVSRKAATSFHEGDNQAAQRLETVIVTVTRGCHATFQYSNVDTLVTHLKAVDPELRGFAYEGVGTGLTALDCILPWKNRTKTFLDGPGAPYIYAVHIGAGLALARMRRRPERFLTRLDPILGWMAIDGYGFHEGFFARHRFITQQQIPRHLSPYGQQVFDQGLGRAIWFLSSANIDRVIATMRTFSSHRHADLWSGIGLACGYTGGVDHTAIKTLWQAAAAYQSHLAVGTAIAANARHRAGSPAPYAELASTILCGSSSEVASRKVDVALQNLPLNGAEPAYAVWRQRLVTQFASSIDTSISESAISEE